jgi:hypothetical protein
MPEEKRTAPERKTIRARLGEGVTDYLTALARSRGRVDPYSVTLYGTARRLAERLKARRKASRGRSR